MLSVERRQVWRWSYYNGHGDALVEGNLSKRSRLAAAVAVP